MRAIPRGEKSLLKKQDIVARRRAIQYKKVTRKTEGGGLRIVFGVALVAASLLAFLALITFDPNINRVDNFHNTVGPAGVAFAETLRELIGLPSYALPLFTLAMALQLFSLQREQRRWPQALSLLVLLFAVSVLSALAGKPTHVWPYGLGGVVGRAASELFVAWFSTVGTVVVMSALVIASFIIGTRLAALRVARYLAMRAHAGALRTIELLRTLRAHQKELIEKRREAAQRAKEEEAAFFAELDKEEAELSRAEALADEAEEAASTEESESAMRARQKLEAIQQREQARLAREQLQLEREATRMAREALRLARGADPRDARDQAVSALASTLASDLRAPAASGGPLSSPVGSDPKWVEGFALEPIAPPPAPTAVPQRQTPIITTAPIVEHHEPPLPPPTPPLSVPTHSAAPPSFGAHTPLIVEPKAPPVPSRRPEFQFNDGYTKFVPPSLDVLDVPKQERQVVDKNAYLQTAQRLTAKLRDFDIDGEVVEIRPGPVVTMYEFRPAPGVKISRIASLSDDLAMAMEAMRVRIVAPIPGKGVVGIEVPNRQREGVFLREIADQDAFQKSTSRLTMCLGKDIEGMPYILDLAKAPHLLIAGTTGSGKSVSVSAMIMSLLLKSTPEEVRFIMVDPKMLELSVYDGIPHLLLPVVTDPRKAALALQWAVDEMTRRYRILADAGVRNIAAYNAAVDRAPSAKEPLRELPATPPTVASVPESEEPRVELEPAEPPKKPRRMFIVEVEGENGMSAQAAEPPVETSSVAEPVGVPVPEEVQEDPRTPIAAAPDAAPPKKLPYIVVIIDELADLMMVASKEVETSIARLAQMARAAGIHLMVATQRPSTDVVTGIIKANFPTRMSFMLRSKPDSMTILGTTGAEALLGMGDMLIMPPTSAHLQRVHGCYVSDVEIKRAVDHLKAQGKPMYDESILKPRESEHDGSAEDDELSDELYDQALAIVSEMQNVSISMLQRKMRIGYNRSARMIERMERDGVVGPADGSKPREVLIRGLGEMHAS